MIDNELLAKFDSIQDLSISEEMLGAYLEGNLNQGEISEIEFSIKTQPEIAELLNEVHGFQFNDDILILPIDADYPLSDIVGIDDCDPLTEIYPFIESDYESFENNDLEDSMSQLDLPSIDINLNDGLYQNNPDIDLNDFTDINL